MRYVNKTSDEVFYVEEAAANMATTVLDDGDLAAILSRMALEVAHETLDQVRNMLNDLEDADWVDAGGEAVIAHLLKVLQWD